MTQRHVEIFNEALESDISKYICDRINCLDIDDYEVADQCINLIEMWLDDNNGYTDDPYIRYSFDYTQYAKNGMTRKEWVETILVPLALALPEEAV